MVKSLTVLPSKPSLASLEGHSYFSNVNGMDGRFCHKYLMFPPQNPLIPFDQPITSPQLILYQGIYTHDIK